MSLGPTVPVSRPIAVTLPAHGVFFAESVHGATFAMPWRRDPFHKLVYVMQGAAVRELAEPRRATPLPPGALAVIPAGVEHRLTDERPSILLLLCLSPAFVAAEADVALIWEKLTRPRAPVLRLGTWWHLRLERLWHRALHEQVSRSLGHAAMIRLAATEVLVQLGRLPVGAGGGGSAERVEFVVHELEGAFFEEWTLDRAAAEARMSRRSFSTYFHRQTGRTFLDFLTELRLGHAAKLLAQGNHSIVGAALAAGCRDLSHFHRLFRRRYGMTPKAWAERGK